jgi:hypothetical protein
MLADRGDQCVARQRKQLVGRFRSSSTRRIGFSQAHLPADKLSPIRKSVGIRQKEEAYPVFDRIAILLKVGGHLRSVRR